MFGFMGSPPAPAPAASAGPAPGGQRDKLGLAMTLAIKWDRPDVLHWLLRRNASRTQRFAFQALIDQFLQMAVHARNEKAVVKLLEYGASLSAYKFTAGADEMEEDIGVVHQTPTRTALPRWVP